MAYIANRPVRFDRNYKVGEVIPPEVIEPKMVRKLIDMGRILCVDILDKDTNTKEDINSETSIDSENPIGGEPVSEGDPDVPGSDIVLISCINDIEAAAFEALNNNNSEAAAFDVPNSNNSEPAVPERFTCKVCGKTFKSQNALSAHFRSHKD